MSRYMTADDIAETPLWGALKAMGMPDHPIDVTVRIRAGKPVEIDATFYAKAADGQLKREDDAFVVLSRTYRLVANEDPPAG